MIKKINKYSLIIIGAGPAGLTASIYASRYKIDNLIIGEVVGGLTFEAHKICNFPTEQEISGIELTEKMKNNAKSLGAILKMDKVISINRKNKLFEVVTQSGKEFYTETILLATGTERRKLNIPKENELLGKGIHYCATCDAVFYKDKTVAVVGGGDSANTASFYLAKVAKKVYQIYRKDRLKGEGLWIDQVINNKKIEVIYNREVIGLEGKEKLEKIILNSPYNGIEKININGLFIEIGTVPVKALIEELLLKTDKNGYIKVNIDQTTSKEGIWAAGDITTSSNNFHQIITACSEGAIAAESIFNFLARS